MNDLINVKVNKGSDLPSGMSVSTETVLGTIYSWYCKVPGCTRGKEHPIKNSSIKNVQHFVNQHLLLTHKMTHEQYVKEYEN